MADRKSLFSRFWPPSASRRTPSTQTGAAPPPATTTKQTPASKSSTSSPPPRRAEAKTPVRQSTTKGSSSPATPPRAEPRKASPEPSKSPTSELQTKDEPKTSSPSRSPPSSKPASPSRLSSQSRSPPSSPQAQSPSRVTPSTPKLASKPASPIRATPRSPKPASPSKAPILASQQEAEAKEEVKPVAANGQAQDGKSFKRDDDENKPSQTSQLGDAAPPAQDPEKREKSKSLDDGGDAPAIKLDAKPEDVKEVVEADEKEIVDSAASKSTSAAQIVEKAEIPSAEEQTHRKKQDGPDMLATPGDATASQPVKKSKKIMADMSKYAKEIASGDHKKAISDRPVSMITLVGENRGASMHMESDHSKRERPIHIHRSYKSNPDQSPEATTDGEESSQGKKSENERCMEDQPSEAYVNNNAQGINNSIVFNTSIVEGSPGVHMVVSHQPIQSKDETSLPEARKAEVSTSRAEKLTYQPTIRRRCLRGLLMETSDSEQEKPRRHGCRVSCQKGNRENSINVL